MSEVPLYVCGLAFKAGERLGIHSHCQGTASGTEDKNHDVEQTFAMLFMHFEDVSVSFPCISENRNTRNLTFSDCTHLERGVYCDWSYWSFNEQSTAATHVACPGTQRPDEHRCGSRRTSRGPSQRIPTRTGLL